MSTDKRLWCGPRLRYTCIRTTLICSVMCINMLACQSVKTAPQQRHELKGKVVVVDPERQYVVISHEEIPGYMGAMTMPFKLKQEWAYKALTAGDRVQAILIVQGDRSWLEDLVITKESTEKAEAGKPESPSALGPKPGDEVPNFSLINQDAKAIQLQQYRGKVLVLTFIYTRCPLPDFCPKMISNFAEIYHALQQTPALYDQTHLLCISFDAVFDTPTVLRNYGTAYAGGDDPETFAHWEFTSGTAQEVRAITQFFGLLYLPETDQIAHSLRTAVITPEGKVFKLYTDNLWTSADLLRDVKQVLSLTNSQP